MKQYKFIKRTQHLFNGGEIIPENICLPEWISEGRVQEVNPRPIVQDPVVDTVIAERIKDFVEDLEDDGKRNRSNKKKPKKSKK